MKNSTFDAATREAVCEWQLDRNVVSTGLWGAQSRAAMWDFDLAAASRKAARYVPVEQDPQADFMEGVQVQANPLAYARARSPAVAWPDSSASAVALAGAATGVIAASALLRHVIDRITHPPKPPRSPRLPSMPRTTYTPDNRGGGGGPKLPPSLRNPQPASSASHARNAPHSSTSRQAAFHAGRAAAAAAPRPSAPPPQSPAPAHAALNARAEPSAALKTGQGVAVLERPGLKTAVPQRPQQQRPQPNGGGDLGGPPPQDQRWAGWGTRPTNATRTRAPPPRPRVNTDTPAGGVPPPRLEFFHDARAAAATSAPPAAPPNAAEPTESPPSKPPKQPPSAGSPSQLKLEQQLAAAERERDLARQEAFEASTRARRAEKEGSSAAATAPPPPSPPLPPKDKAAVDAALADAGNANRINRRATEVLTARVAKLEAKPKSQGAPTPAPALAANNARLAKLSESIKQSRADAVKLSQRIGNAEKRLAEARKGLGELKNGSNEGWVAGLFSLLVGAMGANAISATEPWPGPSASTAAPAKAPANDMMSTQIESQVARLEKMLEAMPSAADEVRSAVANATTSAEGLSKRLDAIEAEVKARRTVSDELAERIVELERAYSAPPPPTVEPPPTTTAPPPPAEDVKAELPTTAPALASTAAPPEVFVEELEEELEEIKRGLDEVVKKPLWRIEAGREVILQGFHWDSSSVGNWYGIVRDRVPDIAAWGFTGMWLPPPSQSIAKQGYMPQDLYNLNSKYGSEEGLRELVNTMHANGMHAVADVVINHRCANEQGSGGAYNKWSGMKAAWDERAINTDNGKYCGQGGHGTGDDFHAAPNIDHNQEFVRNDLKEWLNWLRNDIGFDSLRFDFSKGYDGRFAGEYIQACGPEWSVGEFWDTCQYGGDGLEYNQDGHRQRTVDWIDRTGGVSAAFDFTTKGILQEAVGRCQYWRLVDPKGRPPGVMGIWPSHAVTFIDNHDTGSTQAHWPFPGEHVLKGYAYILTHPGSPCVLWDHVFDWGDDVRESILEMIKARDRAGIHSRSKVKVAECRDDVYAAIVDDRLAMKIGPGQWHPGSGWAKCCTGEGYAIWMAE